VLICVPDWGEDVCAACPAYLQHLLHDTWDEGVVRVLLEYGADINPRDNRDRTPLHGNIEMGGTEVARVLLENGADANARDSITSRVKLWI
jgi:hypothetical protein